MTLNHFFQVLTNPNSMSHDDTYYIEDIVSEFPFFQAARALYLKGLKNQNSFRYNEVLKTTAIYTADRSILFNFITSTDFDNVTLKTNEAQIISELESIDDTIKENLEHFEHNASDEEVEKLNHLMESHDIKSAPDTQESPEFNDISDFFKSSNDSIEKDEIDLIKEFETEKQSFSFDKLDEQVKEENALTFEEEIEKIANEFLKKIESENRTFEPDPEFKLEADAEVDELKPISDFDIKIDNNAVTEIPEETAESSEKLDAFLNYDIDKKIENEIENEIISHFSKLENDIQPIDENTIEKSLILGNKEHENELISHFDKLENSESTKISNQKEDEIENEMMEHFKKIEQQFIKDENIALQEEQNKKEQIKHEVIDYFTKLDPSIVLDDQMFESMTKDLSPELKAEIENEIIAHFTQPTTNSETTTVEDVSASAHIDPIESEIMAHFNQLSSTLSDTTDTEIPINTDEDPIEKEMREHFARYNQDLDIVESEESKNSIQIEEIHSEKIIENKEEIIEREEIVFELLPNEIFTETLSEEKPKVEEKIDIKLDEDFSPPVQFHRNDARSFNEWLKLSTFKPINREIEPEISISMDKKMEIIEEFIEKNPKIEPIKDIVAKPEQNIHNIENEEIMTETLARVYIMQHKYSDAIRAYEILSLKFPEKSSFFADQIKQIENIRRNNLH